MYKLLLTFNIVLLINTTILAQRNPNTNASKIKNSIGNDSIYNTNPIADSLNATTKNIEKNSGQVSAAINYAHGFNTADNLSNGYGFSFKLGFNLIKNLSLPISLYAGLGFDYLYFGGKNLSLQNNNSIAINSNAYGWYPYINLELGKHWPITLFGTAFWGGRFFKTRQNLTYYDANNTKQTKTDNLESNSTQIYGIGAGLKYNLTNNMALEFRYQKNYGNSTNVIDPTSIQFINNVPTYKNINTDTDFDMYFMGIVFKF